MANTFFAADHHLSHSKILTFTNQAGGRLRDFATVDEMNYHIVAKHNSVVKSKDTVYFLGDVTLTHREEDLSILDRMAGQKVLVLGNHDIQPIPTYLKYFSKVKAIHALSGIVLTHVPLHPSCLGRWGVNVHGHLHDHKIADPRYFCVSVEQLDDYTPISLDQLRAKLTS
jgi:calcineurin-like phosphoesterase family protein